MLNDAAVNCRGKVVFMLAMVSAGAAFAPRASTVLFAVSDWSS